MARVLRMPDMAADEDDGVLSRWLVDEATSFDAAQTLAYVETERSLLSVEAGRPGVLLKTLVEPGTQVDPGTPIGVLADPGERIDDLDALLVRLGLMEQPEPPVEPASAGSERPLAPVTRLDPLGLDRGGVTGRRSTRTPGNPWEQLPQAPLGSPWSGGRAETAPDSAPPSTPRRSPSAGHDYLRTTVRVDRLLQVRAHLERAGAVGATVQDLVDAAVSSVHRQMPHLPLAPSDSLDDAGLAVTHPGRYGVEEAAAVVVRPRVAALAVGAVRDAPVVEGRAVVPASVLTLTLSLDRKSVSEADAARWLALLVALLERPEWMLD